MADLASELKPGDVRKGYMFKGGNPRDKSSWEPVGSAPAASSNAPSASVQTPSGASAGNQATVAPSQRGATGSWDETLEVGDVRKGYRYLGGNPKDKGSWEATGGFGRAVLDAATFGLADEARAAGAATGDWIGSKINRDAPQRSWSESYDRALKNERAANDAMTPLQRIAGAAGGGLVNASRVAAGLIAGAPKIVNGAIEGLGLGAAYGAGSGEGAGDRIENAAIGAGLGAGVGAAVPAVTGAIGKASRTFRPDAAADARLAEALRRSGQTTDDISARLAELGPEATIADAGGNNVQALARVVANMPGKSKELVGATIGARQAARPERVTAAIEDAFGAGEDWYPAFQKLDQQRKAVAAPLYEKAYQTNPALTPELEAVLKTPAGKAAMKKAARIAGNEGEDFAQMVPAGQSGVVSPTMRGWDYIKRGLDDAVESQRDKVTGKLRLDAEGRSVDQVRKNLVKALDDANPDYAAARKEWADPTRAMDAMEQGRKFANRPLGTAAETTTERLRGMTPADRDYFRLGVARGLWEQVGKAGGANRIVRDALNSKNFQKAIRAVSPDDTSYRQFMGEMRRLAEFGKTANFMSSGSRTAPMQAEMADLDAGRLRDLAAALRGGAGGDISEGIRLMGKGAGAAYRRYRAGTTEATRDRLGQMLFSQDPAVQQQVLRDAARQQASGAAPNSVLVPGAAIEGTGIATDDSARAKLAAALAGLSRP